MWLATELATGSREIILFAYRTECYDKFNVWRKADGTYCLYMSGDGVFFHLPELSTFQTHLCLTWESMSGMAMFYVDGKRSIRKVYKPDTNCRLSVESSWDRTQTPEGV
ncbi:unnamed protein product [Coregonus sp. 'balchen']|nr:unnamed protein product [Coregonus sp. 'balchen']